LVHVRLLSDGELDQNAFRRLEDKLAETLPESRITLEDKATHLPSRCLNRSRGQYDSTLILRFLRGIVKNEVDERVLAVVSVDLYAGNLNFVFGEANTGMGIAVVSTYRVRPEFYGEAPGPDLFFSRLVKESVHELGHTFGLEHCPDTACVMHFSNSIFDTDLKGPDFCPRCKFKLNSRRLSGRFLF
jgi:archaemetzincin